MTSPSHSQSEPFGLALPNRRNVTVTRRASVHSEEDDDAVPPLSRNSLEGTRRYYNVDSGSAGDRASPRARKTSGVTNSPRPLSYTPSETSATAPLRSPTRGAAPLPTPRGFLAPQKPAAARRLETRERNTSVSTTGRVSTDVRPSLDLRPSGDTFRRPSVGDYATRDRSPLVATPEVPTPTMSEFSHDTGITASSFHTALGGDTGGNLGVHSGSMSSRGGSRGASRGPSPLPVFSTVPSSIHGGESETRRHGASALREAVSIPAPLPSSAPQPLPGTPTKGQQEGSWEGHTTTSSPSNGNRPSLNHEMSSDHLVDTLRGGYGEKAAMQRRALLNKSTKTTPSFSSPAMHVTNTRRYKEFENKNSMFFWGGRLMTGGDSPLSFILSIVIMLGISGVWLGTTGAWLWRHAHEYGMSQGAGIGITLVFVYLFGLTVSSMIAASFREPGVLPRGLDPDPPYVAVDAYWEPTPREIRVGADGKDKVQCKYCESCKSYRPPRCSHCRLCGNCVEGIDHHCAYLHSCVGRRNYFAFLVFVIAASISAIYIVIFSAIHFSMLCHHDHISFKDALADSPGAAVSFALGVCVLPPILFLLWYHVRLLLYNLTTIEQIRASASSNLFRATQRPYNPFAASTRWKNIVRASVGRPQFPSWINANGYTVEDNRRVNPALTTPEKYLELV